MSQDSGDDPAAVLADVVERGRADGLERLAELETAMIALLEDRLDSPGLTEARRVAHKLAGSAGTFGFPEASRIAADLEQELTSEGPLPRERCLRATELTEQLRAALERPAEDPVAGSQDAGDGQDRPRLLVLGPRNRSTVIADAARDAGFDAHVSSSVSEARAHRLPPGASAVAIHLDVDRTDAILRLVADLHAAHDDLVVLGLTSRDAFTDRAAAVEAGVTAFCAADRPAEEVVQLVQQRLDRRGGRTARLVAVDDDPHVLDALRTVLAPWPGTWRPARSRPALGTSSVRRDRTSSSSTST